MFLGMLGDFPFLIRIARGFASLGILPDNAGSRWM
jgi:hypothetical protein